MAQHEACPEPGLAALPRTALLSGLFLALLHKQYALIGASILDGTRRPEKAESRFVIAVATSMIAPSLYDGTDFYMLNTRAFGEIKLRMAIPGWNKPIAAKLMMLQGKSLQRAPRDSRA